MLLVISFMLTIIVGTNAFSFLTNEWTQNFKVFVHQTQQKIDEKSNQFLNELNKKFDNAQNFVEKSKDAISTVAKNLKTSGEKLKATIMKTAETTLHGAGDEVEGFFAEVPNRVSDGLDEILAKLGEVCSWIFRNIIAPILFIIILFGLTYIFVVSGCCGCCCSTLMSYFGMSLNNTFKELKKDEHLRRADRIIILTDLEASKPLTINEESTNKQLSKNVRILKV